MHNDRPPGDPASVLVVDDERDTADLFAEIVGTAHDVTTAYGGEEALEKIHAGIDVVLLDRRMPDIHGDDVLREIRSRGLDCRVVMVTAVDPDLDVIGLDFDDYLVKPVSRETLLDAVDRMLSRDELDGNLQEVLSLASKMATLEAKMNIDELEASEEYAQLEARFAEFRDLLDRIEPKDDLYAELSATKMEALFANP